MDRYRCEEFRRLSGEFDEQITSHEDRATTHLRDASAIAAASDVSMAKGRKARILSKHLERCPLCR